MINVGKWRWPLIVVMPLLITAVLLATGVARLHYEGKAILQFSGDPQKLDDELTIFRFHPNYPIRVDGVAGQAHQAMITLDGRWPTSTIHQLMTAAQACIDRSLARQKKNIVVAQDADQKQVLTLDAAFNRFSEERVSLLSGPVKHTPRADLVAKIEALKARRSQLIEYYPTHSDIPLLAKQIHELKNRLAKPTGPAAREIADLDRRLNEIKLRRDYFSKQLMNSERELSTLKPSWTIVQPIQNPVWPKGVEHWPLALAVALVSLLLGFLIFKDEPQRRASDMLDGLWKPQTEEQEKPSLDLEVVSPEVPSDPLTEKARELYGKWVTLARTLYTPAPEPPQDVLNQVAPLLQESTEFLPQGHDVLARYLAQSVVPGDLAAHVARTVLMTLTGAEEAGVSPEHRLAMALAALFHDLAMVPRPVAIQDNIGSEVGRLSSTVLRRIPGMPQALLVMVEDILIGMDEFKLETWQNVANGKNLEPLSKVLREIDRFEKVMQKQKARLDRRVAKQ